jgi:CBS-domain-containing membrane protein
MHTTASDIMSTDVLTVRDGVSIEEALKILINHRITGMPVVNKKGKMVGVLSEFDILSQVAAAKRLDPGSFAKAATFSHDVDSVLCSASLEDVVDRFVNSRYRRLPVTDKNGRLLGIITRRDLMRVFYYRAKLKP